MSEIVLIGDSIFDNVRYVKPADGADLQFRMYFHALFEQGTEKK